MKNINTCLEKPSVESRPWAIWIWNSCITKEKLEKQLASFIEKGFGGIAIKPSRDMVPVYLSNEFLELFETALKIAKQGNIGVRLVQDFSLPWDRVFESVTNQNKRMRAQCLHLEYSETLPDKKNFEMQINEPEQTIILASKLVNGKIIGSQTKRLTIAQDKNILTWKATTGDWKLVVFRKKDVLDPIAGYIPNVYSSLSAPWYIASVCEVFRKKFSSYARTTFKGFIHELPAYIVPSDTCIPWDDELAPRYQAKYRKKLVEQLPALFFNIEDDLLKNRYLVYSFLQQTVHERFTIHIEKWCRKNGLSQWILCPERNLQKSNPVFKYFGTAPEQGDFSAVGTQNIDGCEETLPLLRYVSDMNSLHYRRETITVIGRNRMGVGATLQQLKADVDRSLQNGPSVVCIDGCFFNIDRRSYVKTPHNPFWYSPNWDFMKSFCDYVARAREITDKLHCYRQAAVLMPSVSTLADYVPSFPEPSEKAMTLLQGTLRELERLNFGFDVISDESLVSCSIFSNGEFCLSNRIRKGNYRALIVPFSRLISMSVLAFIEKLAEKSGCVIFIEEPPQGTLQDGSITAFQARMKRLLQSKAGKVRVAPIKELEALCISILPTVSTTVLGKKCPDIIASHYAMDGADMFCLHNISESQEYFVTLEIPEQKNIYFVECVKGEVHDVIDVQRKDKKCRFNLTFLPKQTTFIVSSSQKLHTTQLAKGKKPLIHTTGTLQRSYCIVLKDQWQFSPGSPNILPLANWNTRIGLSRESGGYSLFYEAYFEVKDVPPGNCILALGGLAGGAAYQQCANTEKPMEVTINGVRAEEMAAWGNAAPVDADAPQNPQAETAASSHSQFFFNLFGNNTFIYSLKDLIRKGINRISLRTLGLVFDPLTIIYPPLIAGAFSIVKGSAGWIISNVSSQVGHDSWTKYGYPYLCGSGIYKQVFELPGEYNRLILRFSHVSDTIDVEVNGKPIEVLNWHPLEIDITDVCESRRNELSVRVVNTLDNILRMNGRASGLLGEAFVDVY